MNLDNVAFIALIALVPILVWRVYSRIKAQLGRQRSILSRHYTGLIVFSAMLLVPLPDLAGNGFGLAALAGGAAGGILLGQFGLRKTRFEDTPEGYFVTPPTRMGVLIAMLLVARVVYVGIELYMNKGSNRPYPRFTDSPISMLCLGVTAAYFATFSASLMRWRHQKRKEIDAA